MSHKNNKNSKDNKKAGNKTKEELHKMKMEISNDIGFSSQTKKLGKNKPKD
ncbi:small, acid-soluble spore protein, alpha/beta type [Clostridium sp. P21]|uniref:Small, acid-soluble spore protein, alpha/beta type n=1 Tax=Clostridium muellerianum TaxID=2716538 RepID=A0A7Y0EKN1_9CLOT|nr:small, acid-soluble spore protein, alpha/beta type [Clostridium muellerianum]NMM64180.1 small, acid-soluble spore protein, alpha/beta type [Clostridium muellerianum]